jgi:hypothetical protein
MDEHHTSHSAKSPHCTTHLAEGAQQDDGDHHAQEQHDHEAVRDAEPVHLQSRFGGHINTSKLYDNNIRSEDVTG